MTAPTAAPGADAPSLPAPDVCAALGVDERSGLSAAEARLRLEREGPNRPRTEPPPSAVLRFVRQLGNSMVLLLVGAATISLAIGESLDAAVILAIVVANAVFGFLQEGRADEAAAAVRELLAPTARVIRDGAAGELPAEDLVRGDIVLLATGDRVPADARLLAADLLQLDESAMTGESRPVSKRDGPPVAAGAPLAERHTAVLAGTTVVRGTGRAVVTATGEHTEMGRIAGAAAGRRSRTPLEERLDRLARLLIPIAAGICGSLAALSFAYGESLSRSILVGVALAVAALPEGLPAVVTITLALSMRRLAEQGAIVRRLVAVETLGSTTVICSDKTGTLTENRLAVERLWAPDGADEDELLAAALIASQDAGRADPLERAIARAAATRGIDRPGALGARPVLEVRPFDSARKRMSVVVGGPDGAVAYVKGAPEALAPLLADPASWAVLPEIVGTWAAEGMRVLLVGRRPRVGPGDEPETGLEPLGLIGMADPPRPAARSSVEQARSAGVRTIMITGDHPGTAASIARATGVASGRGSVEVLTGPELDALPDDDLAAAVRRVDVFARVVPEHKVRIVESLQRDGEVVAMTGDGVNDVPALKAAHIGVAMGRRGTDAASEAADMVLADDDYATIVLAVRQGRAIHENIVRFAHFLFAGNAGEVLAFAACVALGLGAPLTVLQILLVNLLLDGLPAVALGVDPPDRAVMDRPPRPLREGLLDRVRTRLLVGGAAIGAAIVTSFLVGSATSHSAGQSMAFATLVLGRLAFVFSVRGEEPFWRAGRNLRLFAAVGLSAAMAVAVAAIPAVAERFGVVELTAEQWLAALALGCVPLVVTEAWKRIGRTG